MVEFVLKSDYCYSEVKKWFHLHGQSLVKVFGWVLSNIVSYTCFLLQDLLCNPGALPARQMEEPGFKVSSLEVELSDGLGTISWT